MIDIHKITRSFQTFGIATIVASALSGLGFFKAKSKRTTDRSHQYIIEDDVAAYAYGVSRNGQKTYMAMFPGTGIYYAHGETGDRYTIRDDLCTSVRGTTHGLRRLE